MREKKWSLESCLAAYDRYVENTGALPKAKHFIAANRMPPPNTFRELTGMTPLEYGQLRYPAQYELRKPDDREALNQEGMRTICFRLNTEEELRLFQRLNEHLARTGESKQAYITRLITRDMNNGTPISEAIALTDTIKQTLEQLQESLTPGQLDSADLEEPNLSLGI